jgi:TetR/AcrR family transcriptional regulator
MQRRGRKKTEHPETARRILAAAEQMFAERGLAGARTDEIARAAGANKAMLYYYYGDKRRLHRAVLENLLQQLFRTIEAVMPGDGRPRERLVAFVNGYFDFRAAHPNYPRLLQRVMMESPGEVRWIAREYFRPGHRRLCRVIEEGMARGEFRQVDPDQTVITLIGMMAFYFACAPVQSEILQKDMLGARAVAARKRAVLDFLTHGLFHSQARAS